MKVDITADEAVLLIAMLEEQIPCYLPDIAPVLLDIKNELILSLVRDICNKRTRSKGGNTKCPNSSSTAATTKAA